MNTEVAKAPLVLPERLSAVEVGQGVFLLSVILLGKEILPPF